MDQQVHTSRRSSHAYAAAQQRDILREQIRKLRAEGLSFTAIAGKLGLTKGQAIGHDQRRRKALNGG